MKHHQTVNTSNNTSNVATAALHEVPAPISNWKILVLGLSIFTLFGFIFFLQYRNKQTKILKLKQDIASKQQYQEGLNHLVEKEIEFGHHLEQATERETAHLLTLSKDLKDLEQKVPLLLKKDQIQSWPPQNVEQSYKPPQLITKNQSLGSTTISTIDDVNERAAYIDLSTENLMAMAYEREQKNFNKTTQKQKQSLILNRFTVNPKNQEPVNKTQEPDFLGLREFGL